MSSGFYELLNVEPTAGTSRIRSAYSQSVSRIRKRRRALVKQGGDTTQIDLQSAHLEDAWRVLSDPAARRKYDAMLAWADKEPLSHAPDDLWRDASDALVPPAAAAGVRLLTQVSDFAEIRPFSPHSSGREDPPTLVPRTDAASWFETAFPSMATEPEWGTGPRLVSDDNMDTPVLIMDRKPPPADAGASALSIDELTRLIDELGYSGTLFRTVRDQMGLSLDDLAARTHIAVTYLEAVEAEDADRLPSKTFVRGYVREVARALCLDENAVATGYMQRLSG